MESIRSERYGRQEGPKAQDSARPGAPPADAARAATPNRQLQFLTPGGTRIIWVFNQDLDLKASLR